MPVLTRSASATSSNRPYLTPHTPLATHPRALIDTTPLPSLFDKMAGAAKQRKRSTSVQLKSKVDDHPFTLPSIPEESEEPSSDPVKVDHVQKPSDTRTGLEAAVHQPLATSDDMDFEDTPVTVSELSHPNPPPAPDFSLVCGGHFLSPNPLDIHPRPFVAPYVYPVDSRMCIY